MRDFLLPIMSIENEMHRVKDRSGPSSIVIKKNKNLGVC